jgi:hypothetical protein
MKRIVFFAALLSFACAAFAQIAGTPSYQSVSVSLPFNTLAAGTSTNLASGWTTTIYITNTTLSYSSATGTFTTNTVITTNTATSYANFDSQGQRNVGLQFEFTCSGSTTTNVDITIARSVNGVNYDTANNQTFSFAANGTTRVIGITNIDMYGFGYGRVVTFFNRDASRTLTNNGAYASKTKFKN